MSKVLVIVDVQREFDEFIQHDLVDALSKYAETFDTVYQIWDTHNNTVAPTHSFPGQVDSIPKKFGNKHFSDEVKEYIEKIEASSDNGRTFKLSGEEGYVVRVKNNHDWFYVNPEIVDLISKLKDKKVILAGGADGECLEDVYQAFLSFGLKVHINKKYTYSAKTSDDDSVEESILLEEKDEYPFQKIVIKIESVDDGIKIIDFLKEKYPQYNFDHRFTETDVHFPNYIFIPVLALRIDTNYTNYSISILSTTGTEEELIKLFDGSSPNRYDKEVLTIKDIDILNTILDTGKKSIKPSLKPKTFVYEAIGSNIEKIIFYPKSDKELIESQEISFKYGWKWASGAVKPIFVSLYDAKILIFNKPEMKIRKNSDGSFMEGPNDVVARDIKHLTNLLYKGPSLKPKTFIYEDNKISEPLEINKIDNLKKRLKYGKYDTLNFVIYNEDEKTNMKKFLSNIGVAHVDNIYSNSSEGRCFTIFTDSSKTDFNPFEVYTSDSGEHMIDGNFQRRYPDATISPIMTMNKFIKYIKSYMTPDLKPKTFIYEEMRNDKESASEICIRVNNNEDYHKLGDILETIEEERYIKNYADNGFIERNCPYFYFIRLDNRWRESNFAEVVTHYNATDSEEIFHLSNNQMEKCDGVDGVYRGIFTPEDKKSILASISNGQVTIVSNGPNLYPKKFIYENLNDKENAEEIAIIIKTETEFNILKELLSKINYNVNTDFVKGFPCVLYLTINRPDACWSYPHLEDFNYVMNNDIENCDVLHGVYNKPFTIKDIDSIEKTLIYKKIYIKKGPNLSPKKFIYESFDFKEKKIVFEPFNSEDSIEAQKIAFKNGFGWGTSLEQEIRYTNKSDAMFITFQERHNNKKYMFRIPQGSFNSMSHGYNKSEALKRCVDGDFIYTDNLKEFKKLMGHTPSLEPKKFIY